ncbi:MAG: autoinducer binding domain-containing protein [Minwuia sp.]|nr:autoinducer binding domain-containing protein [Minwuia sp.]
MGTSIEAQARKLITAFDGLTDAEAIWDKANGLVAELGGVALTAGALSRPDMTPLWARSSMDPGFLASYTELNLFADDPFIAHFRAQTEPVTAFPGTLQERSDLSDGARALDRLLFDAGYRFLYGVAVGNASVGESRVLTFCSHTDANAQDQEHLTAVRLTLTVIAAHIGPPPEVEKDFTAPMRG